MAIVDYFVMGEAVGIVATLFVSFYYSRKQMKSFQSIWKPKFLTTWMKKYMSLHEWVLKGQN
jgi:hypothetical protein